LPSTASPRPVGRDDQAQITAASHRAVHEAQVAEWAEHRVEIERRLSWLYSQRFQRDVRSTVRALQRQLDRLDERIAAG
jgi:hypothetical protein